MSLFRLAAAGGVGCLCLLALGCEKEQPIRAYQAPRDPGHVHRERIEWKAPADWIEWPGDELTYAGFTLEDGQPALEMTLTYLPRQAPGAADMMANVNRWQRQLGAPLGSKEEVNQLARKMSLDGREGYVVDLMGPAGEKRILGAMAIEGDRVWFLKVMGPSARVEKHKKEFEDFLSSLKLNGPRKEMKDELAWITPPSWTNGDERPMRFLTFLAGDGADPAEVIVTKLGGTSFGNLLDNINRWRSQVGLAPVAKVEDQPSERIPLAGKDAAYFDFTGPGTPENPNRRMLLAMTVSNNDVWFFKMIGPQQVVGSEKGNFDAFLKSVEIGGAEQ
ncbi:MAG TPA: hypothetical protein VGP94_01345 [Tepidisphaeraceae bacterium]|nr:hypothetical protein [Tepidisphaeraceae bacterium]